MLWHSLALPHVCMAFPSLPFLHFSIILFPPSLFQLRVPLPIFSSFSLYIYLRRYIYPPFSLCLSSTGFFLFVVLFDFSFNSSSSSPEILTFVVISSPTSLLLFLFLCATSTPASPYCYFSCSSLTLTLLFLHLCRSSMYNHCNPYLFLFSFFFFSPSLSLFSFFLISSPCTFPFPVSLP